MMPHTNRARSASGVALKMAGTLLALYFVYAAQLSRDVEQNRNTQLKYELDYQQRVAASHDDYAAQLQQMRVALSRVVQRLPSRFDSSAIDKILHDRATLADIQIASMHIGKEKVKEGFYAELPVDLLVQGSSSAFVKFMDGLLRDSPLRLVSDMKIARADNPATLQATITVHYYRYIEEDE